MRGRLTAMFLVLLLDAMVLSAQVDRREVRQGNRRFGKEEYGAAELLYRKALVKDSLSVAARYNLASSLYRQENFDGAKEAISALDGQDLPADVCYNSGDIALQLKDYAGAVDAFKQALLKNPGDLDAKENYIYAKKMLENSRKDQNQQGGGQNDQDKEDQQDKDQQNNESPGQQPQPEPDNGEGGGNSAQQPSISPQQAQQMLNAVQAREQQTRDKVDREKAALLKSRQKEKNW